MARIRTIKPDFFIDDKIGSLSFEARLCFIGLWCLADDYGTINMHPLAIKGQLFPFNPEVDIEKCLEELEKLELIIRYGPNNRYIFIKNFLKHQQINRPSKHRQAPPPEEFGINSDNYETVSEDSLNTHGKLTENSLSTHGALTEHSVMEKEKEKEMEMEKEKEREKENIKYSCSVSSANADETRTTTSNSPPLEETPSFENQKQEDEKKQKLPKGLILSSLRKSPKESHYQEENIVIRLPIKGDKSYKEVLLTHEFVNELEELFPAVDVQACLKKMYAWLCANEKRQKTKQGIKKFITTWLSKEQDTATKRRNFSVAHDKSDIPINPRKVEDPYYEWKRQLGVPTRLDLTEEQLRTLEKLSPAGRKTLIASWLNLQKGGEDNVEFQ
ncbi:MAG: hypothetical protein J7L34_05170 [Thermotogaceae bacterium]|nr:hypothetical protein [Thermotogaceae bacterium]